MKESIHTDETKCLFCRTCETVCSTAKEGETSLVKSRIHVVHDHEKHTGKPAVCQLCDDPPCVEACAVEALVQNEETGVIELDRDECINCGECVDACPYGAMTMVNDYPVCCDLCGGDPLCVKFCAHEGISFGPVQAQSNA